MTKETLIGLGFIIFGIFYLWFTIKNWIKNDIMTGNIKGLIAAIGSIIAGILLLTGYGHW